MKHRRPVPLIAVLGTAAAVRALGRDLPRLRDGRIVVVGAAPGEASETAHILGGRAIGGADLDAASGADLVLLAGGLDGASAAPPPQAAHLLRLCPEAIVIVCGPRANARAAAFVHASRFPASRVLATGGVAAAEALAREAARRLDVEACQVSVLMVGGDAPDLRALPRYAAVAGIPVRELGGPAAGEAAAILEAARAVSAASGRESRAALRLAAAVLRNRGQVFSCGAWVEGAHALPACFATVPVVVDRRGVREIFPVRLTLEEKSFLQRAAQTGAGRTT